MAEGAGGRIGAAAAMGVAGFAGAYFGGPIVLTALGFQAAGVGAGNAAAGIQAGIGNVGAGAVFVPLQAFGAGGVNVARAAAIGVAAAAANPIIGIFR